MNYTKGEWKIDNRKEGIGYFTTSALDEREFPYIIIMPSSPFALGRAGAVVTIDPNNPDGALANAHLIAAAPIGYELADAVLDDKPLPEIRALARRFIAKAEGKEKP